MGKMRNKDPHLLSNLPAYGEEGSVYAVMEIAKGLLPGHIEIAQADRRTCKAGDQPDL
jgi:hypothetical protein